MAQQLHWHTPRIHEEQVKECQQQQRPHVLGYKTHGQILLKSTSPVTMSREVTIEQAKEWQQQRPQVPGSPVTMCREVTIEQAKEWQQQRPSPNPGDNLTISDLHEDTHM